MDDAPRPPKLFADAMLGALARCLRCNHPLAGIDPEEARARVPPWVARTQHEFRVCPECGRIYWPGTHSSRMRERLKEMDL